MKGKLLALLLVVGVMACIPALASAAPHSAMGPVTVTLGALNNSGENGTAVLTDLGNGQTKVDVTVTGEPADASQPMHIHSGECGPTLGGVVLPLTSVVNGKSTTTVSASLESLMDGKHAINGHKSAAEIGTYVFCGNIPAGAMMAESTPTEAAMMAGGTPTAAMMAEGTPTEGAMMAAGTPTGAAMMAEGTPTAAMMAHDTPTEAAMMAAGTPTETAMLAAGTPTAGEPTTMPTTGGDVNTVLWSLIVIGVLAIGGGLLVRRMAR